MLVRISCKPCGLGSLWTDEPGCFLQTICHRRRSCEARLVREGTSDPADLPESFAGREGPRAVGRPAS